MQITYPHFGSLTYVFECLMRGLGRDDVIIPYKPSKKTAELGSRYSPEFICTPFKLTLGTFIEGLERGATELAIGGCHAYCRFGYYWPVQKLILQNLGYKKFTFKTINYDEPLGIVRDLKNNFSADISYTRILKVLRRVWRVNRLTDLVDQLKYHYRALEIVKGQTDALAEKAYRMIVEASSNIHDIRELQDILPAMFRKNIAIRENDYPLRIAVVGEIYVVQEPALNLDIFRKLNKLGVITESPVSLRRYCDIGRKLNPFKKMEFEKADKAAKPFLEYRVGGETQESIGDTILYRRRGWDGMIHLYPFTCMPEIISRSILPEISATYDMPVLSLVVDEQTGETGFQTRLEAFVDLLLRRREEKGRRKLTGIEIVKNREVLY